MTKISKTIKKTRAAKGLTQDTLAERLFVSRQTVSSWENDRTQPDIEMLKRLSEALEISIEELIYGDKPRTDENEPNANSKKTLIIVFSVVASALIGTGLLLIFVTGWEKFPIALKTVFSFAPMLSGQAAAVFTYLKRRESTAFREGAAVLWCAGVIATVAMVNSIYELNSGFETCMFIDALLILPIIYLLDAAAPLVAYYSAVIYYGFYMAEITRQHAWLIFMVVLYLLGFAYVIMNRKKTEDARHIYTVWVSVIAAAATGFIFTLALEAGFFAMLTAMCIGIYALDKNGSWSLPYHTLGLLGGACVSVAATFAWEPDSYWYGESSSLEKTVITAIACLIIVSACVFFGRKTFFKNREKVVFCSCAAVCMILELISENTSLMGSTAIFIIIFVMTIVQAVSLIAEGAKVGRFLPLNIGLVMIAALISFLVLEQDFGTLATGILLVIMGGGLLFVNYVLAKKRQLSEEKEVAEDA